jgi:hypothetical protein
MRHCEHQHSQICVLPTLVQASSNYLDVMKTGTEMMGLTGRPDRMIREVGMVIPEEWK